MARKGLFAAPLDQKLPAANFDAGDTQLVVRPQAALASKGPLGALDRSLSALTSRANEIEARLAAGAAIVEMEPDLVDPPFVADRLAHKDDAEFQALVEAIRERGQDSPILVRPHPEHAGRYQIAFGRRRLRACKALGIKAKAVVKRLNDEELILAQGQENSARENLSYIERALFARTLEDKGFSRQLIMSALSVEKANLSRMISVAAAIPAPLIAAIGAAPAIGRGRWAELAEALSPQDVEGVIELLHSAELEAEGSDLRFERVLELVTTPPTQGDQQEPVLEKKRAAAAPKTFWATPEGVRIAKASSTNKAFKLSIDNRQAPGFGDYLLTQMDRLFDDYKNRAKEG